MQKTIGIIGGGLAGLTLAIQLAKQGKEVVLFEKKKYPFHRVCGEYIAMESWGFLERLGLVLQDLNLPRIRKLSVSSPNGRLIHQAMPTGGFGISRYTLDQALAQIALKNGVKIIHEIVENVSFLPKDEHFLLHTSQNTYLFGVVAGAFGKRSNIDVVLKRNFVSQTKKAKKQFVGIKYHIKIDFPDNLIELHNFEGGYCGISKVDDDKFCLCYLTETSLLQKNSNHIAQMEQNVLFQNPFLKKYFQEAVFLYDKPLAISQISFDFKPLVENHILMLGDSAGMIAPLCGNGMTMAMQASSLLSKEIVEFLGGKQSRKQMEQNYQKNWNNTFATRMKIGRALQNYVFGGKKSTNLAIAALRKMPFLVKNLIQLTHGKDF
ncbi:MAG: NAD(P)/FAD-dependent oxidoreductase [Raineya sp.]